jgi:hypothetical protein
MLVFGRLGESCRRAGGSGGDPDRRRSAKRICARRPGGLMAKKLHCRCGAGGVTKRVWPIFVGLDALMGASMEGRNQGIQSGLACVSPPGITCVAPNSMLPAMSPGSNLYPMKLKSACPKNLTIIDPFPLGLAAPTERRGRAAAGRNDAKIKL